MEQFITDPRNPPLPLAGAYVFCHVETDEYYVGVSWNILRRFHAHNCLGKWSPPRLAAAIRKYGKRSFLFTPVFYLFTTTQEDLQLLNNIETALIIAYDSVDHGFNIIECGNGTGFKGELWCILNREAKRRPEARAKVSRTMRARLEDPANKKALLENLRRGHTPELIARRNAAIKAALPKSTKIRAAVISQLTWVTNGKERRRIHKSVPLPVGWWRGKPQKLL